MKKLLNYFTKFEIALWCFSVTLILSAFLFFDKGGYLTLITSLIGVTSLIFCSKGNAIGQVLMIIFSLIYGVISFGYRYYGEMITYLGMTMPMAIVALISWLKNPYKGNKSEVEVNTVKLAEVIFAFCLTVLITVIFYFILRYLNVANLIPSTVSVATSFFAVYLTFRRSPFFALAYASNDVVLIILWILASLNDVSYLSMTVCFVVFLFNDSYCFFNWLNIKRRQNSQSVSVLQ